MWSPPALGDVIGGRWLITGSASLTAGTDDARRWYHVEDQVTGSKAICEVADYASGWAQDLRLGAELFHRALAAKELELRGRPVIPRYIEFDIEPNRRYAFLCTESIGPTLAELRAALPPTAGRRFSLFTCLHIGMETLIALKELHEAGYMHPSMSPFSFALSASGENVLILFHWPYCLRRWQPFDGLSAHRSRFEGAEELCHRFMGGGMPYAFPATLRIKEHNFHGPEHRMHGLLSWFDILVELTKGSLPWPFWDHDWDTMQAAMATLAFTKEYYHANPSNWLDSTPPEYLEMFKYLSSAPAESEPDYEKLIRLIKQAMCRAGKEMNGNAVLDWEPGGLYYEQLHPLVGNDP